jgi:hypothetical protein
VQIRSGSEQIGEAAQLMRNASGLYVTSARGRFALTFF